MDIPYRVVVFFLLTPLLYQVEPTLRRLAAGDLEVVVVGYDCFRNSAVEFQAVRRN